MRPVSDQWLIGVRMMYNFEFVRPSNVAEAVAVLKSEEAKVLGGVQTLIPTMKQRLASRGKLVSLSYVLRCN